MTAHQKLSDRFDEWDSPPREYGLILLGEDCVIHLLEDHAIPEPSWREYKGNGTGSFYIRKSKIHDVLSNCGNKLINE